MYLTQHIPIEEIRVFCYNCSEHVFEPEWIVFMDDSNYRVICIRLIFKFYEVKINPVHFIFKNRFRSKYLAPEMKIKNSRKHENSMMYSLGIIILFCMFYIPEPGEEFDLDNISLLKLG